MFMVNPDFICHSEHNFKVSLGSLSLCKPAFGHPTVIDSQIHTKTIWPNGLSELGALHEPDWTTDAECSKNHNPNDGRNADKQTVSRGTKLIIPV